MGVEEVEEVEMVEMVEVRVEVGEGRVEMLLLLLLLSCWARELIKKWWRGRFRSEVSLSSGGRGRAQ